MKVLFKNEITEKEFEKLCDTQLLLIVDDVIKKYDSVIMVNKIFFEGYTLNILLSRDDEIIKISSNFKEMQTYVSSNKNDYFIIYDNHPKKQFGVKGYLYQKDNKVLMKHSILNSNLSNTENEYSYSFSINNHKYIINILDYGESFNELEFRNYILNKSLQDMKNINEVYSLFVNSNNISDIKLEIIDKNNNDMLLINHGVILKYHLTYYENDILKEIFLNDNKFYIKETTIKEMNDENIYIKKIGGRYGKR